jgi:dTDP-3-amino-3,4,6-trideoxy-alpha-D-glucose transaminase
VTNDAALAQRIKRLRNGGQTDRYHHQEAGVNSRLDELQAAILRARLPYLRRWTSRRRELAADYRRLLAAAAVAIPGEHDHGHVYHIFAVLSPGAARSSLQQHLSASGIDTLVHYPVPIHRQPVFDHVAAANCSCADDVCARVLSLPLYPALDRASVEHVCAAIDRWRI